MISVIYVEYSSKSKCVRVIISELEIVFRGFYLLKYKNDDLGVDDC